MAERSFVPTASPIFRPGSVRSSYRVKMVHLAPPVLINLREDRMVGVDRNARDLLRPEEIEYFRKNGSNATIFIHGFNVEYGGYGRHVELAEWGYDILRNRPMTPRLIHSQSVATTYRDGEFLKKQYANWHGRNPGLFREIDLENLNGTGAHAWSLHMEDNLNRATGQFDRTDYSRYARLIHVAWSGDVFQLNYIHAEQHATRAGRRLVAVIRQLVEAGIAVNIIAHSLGNRVLLVAMNLLGQMPGLAESIENAFMWQPAVPDTALSNDPAKDTSILRNWNFIHAHRAAKKIVVLYSEQDNILGPYASEADKLRDKGTNEASSGYIGGLYTLAQRFGVCLFPEADRDVVFAPWGIRGLYHRWALNLISDNMNNFDKALQEELQSDPDGLFSDHLKVRDYEYALPIAYMQRVGRQVGEDFLKTVRAVARTDYEVKRPRPAMGYRGPERERDSFISGLVKTGKLILVNQTNFLFEHSGMKIPNTSFLEEIYNKEIFARIASSTGFGSY